MYRKTFRGILLAVLLASVFVIFPVRNVEAVVSVHFYCTAISKGDFGSITFSGTPYSSGQSADYMEGDYWIVANPPAPLTDWFFYRWSVMWLGSQSWVDNVYSQSTWFHLRGEAYLWAYFYSPIHANDPTSQITWGTQQRITGTAAQYSGKTLSVIYYPQGSGMGPPNRNGVPPFGGSGYSWTTVTVNSGSWDTGLLDVTLPISLGQQLPQTYDVYACWGSGTDEEVDSNVVAFTLNPATPQIAAPELSEGSIELEESVIISDQIFSSAYLNGNDMTGTLTVQAKKQGETSWEDIASQGFTSSYGYSSVYQQWGVFYDLSESWTPPEAGVYDIRVVYSGNNYYSAIDNPSTSTLVVSEQSDFGLSVDPTYESIEDPGTMDYVVTVTSINGFDEEVSFTASVEPSADIVLSFDPPSVTLPPDESAQSILHATTTEATPLGNYEITVTASGGGKQYSTLIELSIRSRSQYTIVFIPLNWQGNLDTFYSEALQQASFLIDNVGILTWDNTAVISLSQNLVLNFDKTDVENFNSWNDISQFAINRGFAGDRYVAITNEEIWGDVEGYSNWSPVVVLEDGAVHVTAHELGHSWGLLDEYNGDIWLQQAFALYGYPIGSPSNSYPGDEPELADEDMVKSYGREFDSHRCIMGSADQVDGNGDPIERAYCNAHTKDEGLFGVRDYIGCSAHIDSRIDDEWSQLSGGLVNAVITFYRNGSAPTIHEVNSLGIVGKPNYCSGNFNFSMQVFSQTGTMIYNSSVPVNFWLMPSVSTGSNFTPIEVDHITMTWLAPAFGQEEVNVTLTDNTTNEIVMTQNVTIPSIVPDISLVSVIPSKTVVGRDQIVELDVTIHNQGNATASFNVTAFAETNLLGIQPINLSIGNFTIMTFLWNTTGFDYGTYAINVDAEILLGETDTSDNTLTTDFSICVTITGDIDADFDVDIFDIVAIAGAYGSEEGDPAYHPNYDLDCNGTIDIFDIVAAAGHYGESL